MPCPDAGARSAVWAAVGTSLEWLADNIWAGQESAPLSLAQARYQAINAAAARSGPGAHGLLFCPLAGGQRFATARRRAASSG